jgi:ribosomal protein S18 acetylase RimI-like enzyme
MDILQAKETDLIEILYLLKVCILDMNLKGLKHWNSAYPDAKIMERNLENGFIYLAKDKGVCKGMVTLNEDTPADYFEIDFSSGCQKPLYLQYMAVHPRWQRLGIAKLLIEFAAKLAKEKKFDCIRLDVFKPSENARQLYEKYSFKEVSPFLSEYQKIPFVCYEKQI